ncbi:MAG: hypothetical protein EA403_15425 [Spirochaetaceae bacterium]|nr:MAG: hypothetical protein EA403_15425 [Spirochaetaceae bacterium]
MERKHHVVRGQRGIEAGLFPGVVAVPATVADTRSKRGNLERSAPNGLRQRKPRLQLVHTGWSQKRAAFQISLCDVDMQSKAVTYRHGNRPPARCVSSLHCTMTRRIGQNPRFFFVDSGYRRAYHWEVVRSIVSGRNREHAGDRILTLLATDAFLTGLAYGLLYNVGYTLLLYRFGSAGLRGAYLLAGAIVPLVSLLFQAIEERVTIFRLSAGTKMLFAGAAPALYLVTLLGRAESIAPYLVMLTYTMGALYAFMLRGSTAAEVYDPRRLKGVYPLLTAWEMGAVICAGLAVAPLSRLLGSVEAILPLTGVVLLVSLWVGRSVRTRAEAANETQSEEQQHGDARHSVIATVRTMLTNRYAMLVFLYQFLAFTTSLLVQYVVYSQAQRVFTAQTELTQFIGLAKSLVTAGAMLFTFLAAGRLLLRYGMLAGLGAGPVLVSAGIIASLIAGSVGVPPHIFLTVLVAVQVLEYGSYSGFAKTSLQSAFQPLPAHEREAVHGFAQGIGIPLSYGFSGLLLTGLAAIGAAGAAYAVGVTLMLAVTYGVVGILLFRAYGTQLRTSLARRRIEGVDLVFNDASTREALHRLLDTPDRWQVHAALELMHEAHMPDYEPYLHELIESPYPGVRTEALSRVEELRPQWAEPIARSIVSSDDPVDVRSAAVGAWCATSEDPVTDVSPLLSSREPQIRAAAVTGLFLYGGINGILTAGNVFNALLNSLDPADRRHAADILARLAVKSFYQPVKQLLRDADSDVRLAALRAAGAVAHPALLPDVIRLSEPPTTRAEALAALGLFGDALPALLRDILGGNSLYEPETGVRIVRAAARSNDRRVTEGLAHGLTLPPGELSCAVLQALVSAGYRATGGTIGTVLVAIETRLQRAAVSVVTLHDLAQPVQPEIRALTSAVQDRYRHDVEESFLLLSLLHAPDEVQGARRKMMEGSQRDRALAAEMLDVTLSGLLRQKMLAVTEHRDGQPPPVETYTELFAVGPLGTAPRVQQILDNRREWPEKWLQTCAGAAAWRLGIVSAQPEDIVLTTIERVLALKTADMFAGIPDAVLAHIASIMEEVDAREGEEFIRKGELGTCMFIIREGRVAIHDGERRFAELGAGEVVGEMAVLDPQPRSASASAVVETVLLRLDKDPFDSVMADHPSLAQGVIAVLCRRLRGGVRDG